LVKGRGKSSSGTVNPMHEVAQLNAAQTNVLLFADPGKRVRNLLDFVKKTPIDLIVMAPATREKFSNRLLNDVLVKLLRVTDSPVLLLR
jgi:nucleotide-binding universal stress UspA family protein